MELHERSLSFVLPFTGLSPLRQRPGDEAFRFSPGETACPKKTMSCPVSSHSSSRLVCEHPWHGACRHHTPCCWREKSQAVTSLRSQATAPPPTWATSPPLTWVTSPPLTSATSPPLASATSPPRTWAPSAPVASSYLHKCLRDQQRTPHPPPLQLGDSSNTLSFHRDFARHRVSTTRSSHLSSASAQPPFSAQASWWARQQATRVSVASQPALMRVPRTAPWPRRKPPT
mmetsp:Transcript_51973/g.111306  ORF Transcript_51973/g.111306 Transcript_51973/m.111306 type:complete len:230 (-) Transcript_51973:723-1412(-)